ncbi:MAG TPA: TonB-dependent receptor [Edaphobacter sp.]|nr:TonB-dependent receptor [Edaphobacter sp.]
MQSCNHPSFPSSLCAVVTLLFSSPGAWAQISSSTSSDRVTVSSPLRTEKTCPKDPLHIAAECAETAAVRNPYPAGAPASLAANSSASPTEVSPKKEIGIVKTEIKVVATQADSSEGYERKITPKEIETSAGTFGDPSRYMQLLPGIVSDNDKFNDFIVRGGNSQETLFIVDNIEMPSINQLSLSDTTGGFVSMIDNKAIQQMTLHTDTYDSKFDQRLSAVVEISTTKNGRTSPHAQVELGMAGAGGSIERPWGTNGSMFLSGRQSILNLLTNDIGMNGVPVYSNSLFRADKRLDEKNNFWGLSLTGVDSIRIHPNPNNRWQTNPYDIAYKGWRNTTGLNWQHIFSNRAFGVLSLSNSEQSQSVRQNAQLLADATVYAEDTRDGITRAKYDGMLQLKPWLTLTAGVRTALNRTNYRLNQPLGLQNPYSEAASPVNATSLYRNFSTLSSAEYSQASLLLPHGMKLVLGQRFSHWAILGSQAWTPKALFMMPIFGRIAHIGYAEYAQLPPSLYILAFNNQAALQPIRSRHITAGFEAVHYQHLRISVEAYQKRYSDYPVASGFPQLSLANITNTFGQAFLMFPMTSKGLGVARGIEMGLDCKLSSRFTLTSAVTYSRSWYSGLDGVLRRGSFDLPFVANVAGNLRLGKTMVMSSRYSVASGKPYTPDNLLLSTAQNRDVYDLSKINALRASAYSRMDFRMEQSYPIKRGTLTWHVGLQNALGANNFYSYEWRPRAKGAGVLAQEQMPRFPDAGFKYVF